MIRYNEDKLNGCKVKLFIRPNKDEYLIDKVLEMYPNDCIEVYYVYMFGQPIDDRAEFFMYPNQYYQDLPVLLVCSSGDERFIKERHKRIDI